VQEVFSYTEIPLMGGVVMMIIIFTAAILKTKDEGETPWALFWSWIPEKSQSDSFGALSVLGFLVALVLGTMTETPSLHLTDWTPLGDSLHGWIYLKHYDWSILEQCAISLSDDRVGSELRGGYSQLYRLAASEGFSSPSLGRLSSMEHIARGTAVWSGLAALVSSFMVCKRRYALLYQKTTSDTDYIIRPQCLAVFGLLLLCVSMVVAWHSIEHEFHWHLARTVEAYAQKNCK